jgi:hypothetical protein
MIKHCVITGAADGIGRALAQRFAAAGYAITGVDVDAVRAAETQAELQGSGASVDFIIANLQRPADCDAILAQLNGGQAVDVFIHNAGINAVGRFEHTDLARQQTVLDINLRAPMLLTAGLLRQGSLAPGVSLVFVASLSYFTGYPGASVYAAAKDGLAAYARSLSAGLARRNMHVLTVYPGPTRTAHARRYSPDNRREARRMPPERLANLVYQAVLTRRRALIPGVGNRVFATLAHYVPSLAEFVMRKTILERL